MATIVFREITKQFRDTPAPAVNAVSFEVPEGSTCMLVGTSGSGKTTLLRMINRLIEHTSGEIPIDGTNILDEDPIFLRRRLGYVHLWSRCRYVKRQPGELCGRGYQSRQASDWQRMTRPALPEPAGQPALVNWLNGITL